ncbi:MAG: GNAT family N-acetyltransferase [Rhodothermales bacterium]
MHIRIATEADLPVLADLYAGSVNAIGPEQYSEAQVASWASFARKDTFCRFILESITYVAEDESGVLGFCGLSDSGHIASLYVRSDCTRQGIGSKLLATALDQAVKRGIRILRSEASEFSYPLFLKFGFILSGMETVDRNGVIFNRYLVEKHL